LETAELIQLIKTRRSIHSFQDKPVPETLLVQAVETAIWAPNGGNSQNWHFLIILDKKVINAIADAIQANLKTMASWSEMANSGPPPGTDHVRKAPALIVVTTVRSSRSTDHVTGAPIGNDAKGKRPFVELQEGAIEKRAEYNADAKQIFKGLNYIAGWVQSTSAAVAYLMLVLHQMGLSSVWMTGPLHAKADIEKTLKLLPGMDIVTLVPVGYPAENPTKKRKPVSEVCEVIK
jgi:nitroreductase